MVFVCAGMGGGTGTGSAPVVANVAREMGSIVIGTVTMPFRIERARVDKAEFGLMQLRKVSDTVIVIDNNRLVTIAGNLPIQQAFAVANELISTMIKGIVETIAVPSLVNLDYADVKTIMTNGGVAAIGVGASDTNNRVDEALFYYKESMHLFEELGFKHRLNRLIWELEKVLNNEIKELNYLQYEAFQELDNVRREIILEKVHQHEDTVNWVKKREELLELTLRDAKKYADDEKYSKASGISTINCSNTVSAAFSLGSPSAFLYAT